MYTATEVIGVILDQKYRILRQLGDGGMAYVFEAERLHLGDLVAVKLMHPELATDARKKRRFSLEAHATAAVKHPNVVCIYDYQETAAGQPYLVLELLRGQTLLQSIRGGQVLTVSRVVEIINPIAAALSLAHGKGILHRDLKPSNIFLHHLEDGTEVVKLIDFGIVKVLSEDPLTQQGYIVGTPEYLSPERYSGRQIDARSDIYSLGVLVFRLLTGRVPFAGRNTTEILQKHLKQPIPSINALNEQVTTEVEAVVSQAMAKHPDHRQATVLQFAAQLQAAEIRSGNTKNLYWDLADK
jgi:serine/threonine-protein kinase